MKEQTTKAKKLSTNAKIALASSSAVILVLLVGSAFVFHLFGLSITPLDPNNQNTTTTTTSSGNSTHINNTINNFYVNNTYINNTYIAMQNSTFYDAQWLNQSFEFPLGNNLYIFNAFVPLDWINYTYSIEIQSRFANCSWLNLGLWINGTHIEETNQWIILHGTITNSSDLTVLIQNLNLDLWNPNWYVTFDFYFYLTKI